MPKSTPRISFFGGQLGSAVSFTDTQRAAIEKAYGHKLSSEAWDQIIAATNMYIKFTPAERHAVPIEVFLKKVQRLKAAVTLSPQGPLKKQFSAASRVSHK
jgi:hypothetical protein